MSTDAHWQLHPQLAEGTHPLAHIGLDFGVAMFTLGAQPVEYIGDHVADHLELGDAETARRAGG